MILSKMRVVQEATVLYFLDNLRLNDYLNQRIVLRYTGNIYCIQCGRKTKQSFQQGYCFPCMQKINECNNCMIHPERCLVETHGCNPTDWAHAHCHQTHLVYLANSSGLKIGITRTANNPTRWIDQGAAQALPIFETHNRYQAGLIEVAFKTYIADKTNWRVMLRGNVAPIDLQAIKKMVIAEAQVQLAPILKQYSDRIVPVESDVYTFNYPVIQYPEKIITLSFDKTPEISGVLKGIKGQYLLLDSGLLNIRKFGGYEVEIVQMGQ